jgi:DNA polymerase-3 subunit delta
MIIFLYGPDTFRSRRKLKEIKDKFIKEVDKSGLNIEVLDGSKLEPSEFEKAISTQPFLANKRLVIIEDLISKNKGQKIQKEILEMLDQKNIESTIIVFWESGLSGSKEKKSKLTAQRSHLLANRLKQERYAQEFNLLEPAEVFAWTNLEFKNRDGKIQPAALRLLVDLVGNDLWQMNSEIDKLLAFTQNKTIATADINSLVKTKLDEDIFKLTEAIGHKNKKVALKLIADQLKSGTTASELLAKIVWQFKNLLLVKEFSQSYGQAYPAQRLTYQLGLHPFVIKKTLTQIKNYQLETLKHIYQHLLKIDYQIKTSQANPEVLLDLLIIKS